MPKKQHDDDDERILKDGQRRHVSMMMLDGLSDLQRSVRDAVAPLRVVDACGKSGLALSRPGPRYLAAGTDTTDHATLVMRDHECRAARDEYVQQLGDAWKGTGTDEREVTRVHYTGDAVRDAYLDQKYDLENSWHRGTGKR